VSRTPRDGMATIADYRYEFRARLRSLEWADEWPRASFETTAESRAYGPRVRARLYEAGCSRYGWPPEAGRLGGNAVYLAVYYDELSHAMLPIPAHHWSFEVLGPTLLKFAPELAAQYLSKYLADIEWRSVPPAKSEVGSGRSAPAVRAVDDGASGLVIKGEIYTASLGGIG